MDNDRLAAIRTTVHRQWAALLEKKATVPLRDEDKLEHLIDAWHDDNDNEQQLWEYCGMTWPQYSHWVNGGGIPEGWVAPQYEIKKTEGENMQTSNIIPTIVEGVEPVTGGLDGDGMLDLSHMRADYFYLQELLKQRNLLDEAIKVYENKFKAPMDAVTGSKGFKVDGLPRYRYERNGTFPKAKYAAANPHVYAAYQRQTTEFDVDAFKRDRPDEYAQWRAPRFVAISETKKS